MIRPSLRLAAPMALLAGGVCIGLAVGCDSAPEPRAAVVSTWVDAIAVPAHRDFAAAATTLAESADAACAAPSEAAIERVRADWSSARGRWQALQVFAFGPYDAYPARLGPHIDFRPLRVELVEARLADPPTVDNIDEIGAAERGLPAIEYLLWAADGPWEGARCQYLVAATADTARLAGDLHAAWRDGFAADLTAPDGEPYADTDAAFSALLNRMGDQVLVLREDALGRPLGEKAGGVPQPQLVSSPFAGRARDDLRDVLESLWTLYVGEAGRPGLRVMPAIVDRRGAGEGVDVDAAFRAAYADALTAVHALRRPLAEAVVEDRAAVEAAIAALGRLQTVLQADITGVLAVELAFGSGDGD